MASVSAVLCRSALFSFVAACSFDAGDCDRSEPTSSSLTFTTNVGASPRVDEELSVLVQFFVHQGEVCNDGLEGCSCSKPPPSLNEFQVQDASCPDEGCEIVEIGPYVTYGLAIDVVPKAANSTLHVKAITSKEEFKPLHEAEGDFAIIAAP